MENRHINYKSDFVIRERFRDGSGKVRALPDVDFEMVYRTSGGKAVTASRKDGVMTNCVADGDALLVIFKDHGLGEGELRHELHLALNNALFDDGVQNVYYPENLKIWLWDKASDTDGVIESDCVAAYTRGEKFTWDDFTETDIVTLQKPATEAAERAEKKVGEFVATAQERTDAAVKNAETATANAETATEQAKTATAKANTATEASAKTAKDEADVATVKATTATTECTAATVKARSATDYATVAGQQAASAAERLEATCGEMESAIAKAEQVTAGVPTGLKVEAPETVTLGNPTRQYIKPKVKPDGCGQNVIYQRDGESVMIEPNGEIEARAVGKTRVHVIPTEGTQYYKTIEITVVPPRMRLTGAGVRLDKEGNIRLT